MTDAPARSRQLIAEEAAEWFVELREKPPERKIKDRFVSWLTESPVHVEEYLAIAQVFGVLRQVDAQGEIDPEGLVDETVVALHGEVGRLRQDVQEAAAGPGVQRAGGQRGQQDSPGGSAQGHRRSGTAGERAAKGLLPQASLRANPARRFSSWMAAAALVLGIGASALYFQAAGPDVYATRLGEQRSVVLEDGSIVSLNTSTTIEVAFTHDQRQVRLTRGEALFDVEKDAARPFLVETRAAVIRVTGTQFNVYDKDDGTAVTVLEGTVEIVPREAEPTTATTKQSPDKSSGSSGSVTTLGAGHQALVKSGSVEIQTTTVANLEPVTAWTERRLVFDATPLSEIVQQFNRYNRERLVIDDPRLASLELSGVFGSNDPQSLVLFLERIAEVEVVRSADGTEIRIRVAKAGS